MKSGNNGLGCYSYLMTKNVTKKFSVIKREILDTNYGTFIAYDFNVTFL